MMKGKKRDWLKAKNEATRTDTRKDTVQDRRLPTIKGDKKATKLVTMPVTHKDLSKVGRKRKWMPSGEEQTEFWNILPKGATKCSTK